MEAKNRSFPFFFRLGLLSLSALTFPAAASDEAGKLLFTKDAKPACAICHTLEAAGASGAVGPSLDDLQPDENRVLKALKNGIGQMPSFSSTLSEEQMVILARYVAKASKAP